MLRVVFGAPHMDVIPCVDAVVALANLVVHSLQEDKYGVVQRDVAEIVRLFTQTIVLLQTFAAGEGKGALKPHWTDVDYAAESEPASQGGRTVREVEELLQALRTGLGEMLQAFRPHLTNVGLSAKDIKAACQAAGVSQI
ncbi:hypothetical protein KEM52_003269 [Ascosphaera acerosa]|nr:hypothetical protein KEM52_003269 [Ascosphaera acerosa]